MVPRRRVLDKIQGEDAKMTSSLNRGAAQLDLVFLTLLCSAMVSPSPLLPPPLPSTATVGVSDPQPALQQLSHRRLDQPHTWTWTWTGRRPDPERVLLMPGQEGVLLRAQRGHPMALPRSSLPGGHSTEILFYQDGGDGEEDERRSEALTSIVGGLQAVNRKKGGFGFRFGRKRWTQQGWGDEGRGSTEEDRK
ncbi:uncharacterized protein qrfp [Solea solea]|uniref:uncharacterized protein qrfp n=1 Tax=Solea solea TaxID=90069 RepID=UPI00272D78C3|nr:uncharacterized protein qrfp [Solea solea]